MPNPACRTTGITCVLCLHMVIIGVQTLGRDSAISEILRLSLSNETAAKGSGFIFIYGRQELLILRPTQNRFLPAGDKEIRREIQVRHHHIREFAITGFPLVLTYLWVGTQPRIFFVQPFTGTSPSHVDQNRFQFLVDEQTPQAHWAQEQRKTSLSCRKVFCESLLGTMRA